MSTNSLHCNDSFLSTNKYPSNIPKSRHRVVIPIKSHEKTNNKKGKASGPYPIITQLS